MRVTPTALPDVLVLEPRVYRDARGTFTETWRDSAFREAVADVAFVQDNESRSERGVLRGLHYQVERPQGKLVRVTQGSVFDVAVDLRAGSPSFGRWVGMSLSAGDGRLLWIPPGFAHGFYVTSSAAEVAYKCTEEYVPELARAVAWDDPRLAVAWPLVGGPPVLSAQDAAAPGFDAALAAR